MNGWAHIQVRDEHFQRIREQLKGQHGKLLELHFGNTTIPVYLDDDMPLNTMKMVSYNPFDPQEQFVVWIENIDEEVST